MRRLCFLLLILPLLTILGATPLLATDVIVTAVPNYIAVPTVVTDNETNVSHTWGYICANITDIGTATPTVRGLEWGNSTGNYTWSWNETGSFSEGEFCHNVTGLTCNETYYFRGFATSSDGTGYGDEESFTTLACILPTVDSSAATDITNNSGVVHGSITSAGGENANTRGFEWGNSTGNYTSSWNETGSFGVGTFSRTAGNLTLGTEVFWRAFATNTIGTGYSGERSFTTLLLPLAPTDFTTSQIGPSSINITWTMGIGADTTVIVGKDNGCPTSVTDGYLVYNGTGTYVEVTGLSLSTTSYCYHAWSWNTHGYSIDFAQGSIGGSMIVMAIVGIICIGALAAGFAFKQPLILICAGIGWVVFGALMFTSGPGDFGTPLFVLGLAFALVCFVWPLVIWMRTRTRRITPEERDYETYRQQVLKATHQEKTEI